MLDGDTAKFAVALGRVPAYVHGGSNYVSVEDVCEGHIAAYERGRAGERYILSHENLTHREIFERIARIVGGKPPRLRVPYPAALAAGLAAQAAAGLAGREPELDVVTARMSRYYFYFTYAKAQAELGYNPRRLDQSIADAHRWLPLAALETLPLSALAKKALALARPGA